MKKYTFLTVLLGIAAAAFSQVTLDQAIKSSAEEMSGKLEKGGRIAVLNVSSISESMSTYVIDELGSALINDGRLKVVERDAEKLDFIRKEIDFSDSGEVSQKSALQIGRMLEARYIISGKIIAIGSAYRLTIEVLEVEPATKEYLKNFNIQNDQLVRGLLIADGQILDYTIQERAGTAALNLAFGTGSFVQKDTTGGTIIAIAEGLGVVCMIVGGITYNDWHQSWERDRDEWGGIATRAEPTLMNVTLLEIPMFPIGLAIYGGGAIYGAVRAFTYHKPGSIAAADIPWNIAFVPDRQGNTAVRLSYTVKF
jgi:TolB-like protein